MMKSKINLKSKLFIILVSVYFSFILNIKFWTFVSTKAEVNSLFEILAFCCLPFALWAVYLFLFSIITIPYIGKPLIALLLICSAASDYWLNHLGIVINPEMIRNLVETTAREAADFITLPFICYVAVLGILPAVGLLWVNINFEPLKKEIKNRLLMIIMSLIVIGLIIPVFYKPYISFGRNNYQVRYYVNTFNYVNAIVRYYKKSANKNRKFVILDEHPQINLSEENKQPKVLVVVLGETARANNFSLYGYEKKTNPLLEKQNIIVFKNTTSCGTSTAVSLPCMFSFMGRHNFDVMEAKFTQNVLDIAQAAGYDVIWKDNDDGCKDVCMRTQYTDARAGNKQPFCFGDYCYDDILLDGLSDVLDGIKKDTLIVLHAMGSHGPSYYKRYPKEMEQFKPSCQNDDLQECSQDEIINAYDNTILYTDYLVSSVIDILKTKHNLQTEMLFVSDHGESLGEHNIYLHSLPFKFAPKEQKEIPMILWLSDDVKQNMHINSACLAEKAANDAFSHDNYSHTLMGLLDINSTVYKEDLDILHGCRTK